MAAGTIVVFSGGPDSTAAALWAINLHRKVELVTFQFGNQPQYGELRAAISVASLLRLPHTIVDFKSPLSVFPSNLTILMHGKAQNAARGDERMPFGAGLVLSFTAAYALSNGVHEVVWGATRDDGLDEHEYGEDFANDLGHLIARVTGEDFKIRVPLARSHKAEVFLEFGDKPDMFALTWSCVSPRDSLQCGVCGACRARRTSALYSGISDRTHYYNARKLRIPKRLQGKRVPDFTDEDWEAVITDPENPPTSPKYI